MANLQSQSTLMRTISLAVLSLVFILTGCRTDEQSYSTYASRDFALSQRLTGDVWEVMDEVARATPGIRTRLDCIESLEVDTLSSPATITVNFGSDGTCTDLDGLVRTGRIHCSFTGRYTDEGTVVTITTSDYTVDGYQVDLVQTVTNHGIDIEGFPYLDVSTSAEVGPLDADWTTSFQASQRRYWVFGDVSDWWIDDVYEIAGSAQGVNRNGTPYKAEITSPLRMEVLCPYISEGTVEVSPDGQILRTLDYGSGECNATLNLTVNGTVFTLSQ